ncbi:MAG: cell division protein FtsL [Gammaproteobacteria bacterium]|nr:cell division protein FtsL [Gammaproteobacteria bacterium]
MNAAARVIHQSNVFTGHWFAMRLSKDQGAMFFLVGLLLLSCLAIVYVTNEYRFALSELESAQNQFHERQMEWGQLLLEQASLSTPGRVEELASQQLGMHLPAAQVMLVLHSK